MRSKRIRLAALAAALALVLAGCSLAQPERQEKQADRFVGVFLVCTADGVWDALTGNPNLVEYGQEELTAEGLGSFTVPREVLIAQYDPEERTYTFPGLEGWALFTYTREDEDRSYVASCSDMAETSLAQEAHDEGTTSALEGTIYYGPPADAGADWDPYDDFYGIWHAYQVYQAPDGTVYIDGSGNSYSGGGSMGFTHEESCSSTVNGETVADTVSVKVNIELAPRIERLVVSQFGADNTLLRSQELPLGVDLEPMACGADAAWALVEAYNQNGTVERTAYTLPDPEGEPIYHPVVILDDQGMGTSTTLEISQARQ